MNKVVKFGGSSLASAQQFKKVGDIIKADADRRFVVPSAPGKRFSGDTKVTDMLIDCYNTAEAGKDFSGKLDAIKARYMEIIEGLELDLSLDDEFETIKKNFEAKAGIDYAKSRGEYLNGGIMANYLGYEFIDAADVIRFDEDGIFESERTDKLLKKRLAGVEAAVLPGFYGANAEGVVVTFSRGGSDVTGSILARAIHADIYENWTDVSGMLVADPHIVRNPEPVDIITYKELRELSYMGATVLHEDAIFPVRKAGIPINIRNTNKPEDPGTMIVATTSKKAPFTITGIAGKKGFCTVTIDKDMMNSEVGFCRRVLEVFEEEGLSIEHMPSGIDTMCVLLDQEEFMKHEQKVLSGIRRAVQPDDLDVKTDLALIAVVGRGMKEVRGVAARLFEALARAGVNCKMIDQGSSEINIIIGVSEDEFKTAIQSIYDTFVKAQL